MNKFTKEQELEIVEFHKSHSDTATAKYFHIHVKPRLLNILTKYGETLHTKEVNMKFKAEIKDEIQKLDVKDLDGNERTEEELRKIAVENLRQASANYVDGERDTDAVNASLYTKVSTNTEIYASLAQSLAIEPYEYEKKIVVDGKSYTVKNYATENNNNPFISTRHISYEVVDIEVNGEMQKQLVVKGDFISVVADDGQDDNVKIIGNDSYLDLGDGSDYLEAKGTRNMLFGGIGKDFIKVEGSQNVINGDIEGKADFDDSDVIEVIGEDNVVIGGNGIDTLRTDGENTVWRDIESITGLSLQRVTLTNEVRETTIVADDGKEYQCP